MANDRPGRWVEELSWPDVEFDITRGVIGVVPIGAASKEHGRHLPCGTDAHQARWLAEQLCDELPVLVWPIVNYGYYPAFVDYPGSISLGAEVFRQTIEEILAGIRFAGISRVALVNTGISTIGPLQELVAQPRFAGYAVLLNVYSGRRFTHACEQLSQQAFGGHADEIETSLMLAINEQAVDMRAARKQALPIVRGLFNRTEPDQANYSPDGVNGDPSLATHDKGLRLAAALREDCIEAVKSLLPD